MTFSRRLAATLCLGAAVCAPLCAAFVPAASRAATQLPAFTASATAASATQLRAAAMPVPPNPFKKLPWNVRKEKVKQARKLKLQRAALHRQLGIAEDATYEEIVSATDLLVARAGDDLKQKIRIEVAKDQILQIRLNERLAGLAGAESSDARAQSRFEKEGNEVEDMAPLIKEAASYFQGPKWMQNLIVKPDEKHVKGQIRLWGIITALGLAIPPAQEYLGRFTWLVCIAQLTYRGMPREQVDGGGMAMSFSGGRGGGSHRKVAFALGVATWIFGAIVVYGFMPAWAKGQRWTGTIAFTMQNLIFGVASSFLQPYKAAEEQYHNNPPQFHEVEATLVIDEPRPPIYNAVAVENVDDSTDSWLKRHQKWAISGLVLGLVLIIGVLIGTITSSEGGGDNNDPPPLSPPIETLPFPISATPIPTLKPNPIPTSVPTPEEPTPNITPEPSLITSLLPPLSRPFTNPSPTPEMPASNSTPEPMTDIPTLKPASIPTSQLQAQLQASSLELVPSEEIRLHYSSGNVAIYGDTAIVGAPYNYDGGSAFVLVRDENGEWAQQAKLLAPNGAADDNFGWSVGIYGDTVIVGVNGDGDNGFKSGSAHIFVRNGTTWLHQTKLLAPDGAADDKFGFSVGIYGDTVIVGAHEDDDNGDDSGSAHLFVRNGTTWLHQAKLLAPDGAASDRYGYSVGIYGDTVIVSAQWDDANGYESGSAHLYVRNGITWSHQAKLLAPDGSAGDYFGRSVGIYGDTVIVGGIFHDDDNGYRSGSAHLFVRNGMTWSHQAKLLAPDGAADDRFGWSVAIYGDTVIVGGIYDDDNGYRSGSAHLFVRNGVTWTHYAKLLAPKSGQGFGQCVDIYNGTSISASRSGEVYVFSV